MRIELGSTLANLDRISELAPAVTYFDRSSELRFTLPVRPGIVRGAKRISAGDRIDGALYSHLAGSM
jgi:hypothetical protein